MSDTIFNCFQHFHCVENVLEKLYQLSGENNMIHTLLLSPYF